MVEEAVGESVRTNVHGRVGAADAEDVVDRRPPAVLGSVVGEVVVIVAKGAIRLQGHCKVGAQETLEDRLGAEDGQNLQVANCEDNEH